MGARIRSHITETKSRQIFEASITDYGDMLFRIKSERDYGVDGEVELFLDGEPTGRIAHVQLKGTQSRIEKLKRSEEVSCRGITKSNLSYCRQGNIPVMLVYVSTADGMFYYRDLQPIFRDKIEAIADGVSCTVRIPTQNNSNDLGRFVEIVNGYYDREEIGKASYRREAQCVVDEDVDDYVGSYEFEGPERPTDGEHRHLGERGTVLSVGCWRDGKLQNGTEFDFLIRVKKGRLVFKPNCPDDSYDSSDDFEYEKLEQYGWFDFDAFPMARNYILEDGFDNYFVADFDVTETTEQMKNIRTIRDFLKEKDPDWLKELEEDIDSESRIADEE